MQFTEESYDKLGKILQDLQDTTRDRIIVWLVQTGVARIDQLLPILDGTFEDDLPDEMRRTMPAGRPTGLGDGSLWPQGMDLPTMGRPYRELLNVSVSVLERLGKLDGLRDDFQTVAELQAKYESITKNEYLPRHDKVEAASAEVERRLRDETLSHESRSWLTDLATHLFALSSKGNWTEEKLREDVIRSEERLRTRAGETWDPGMRYTHAYRLRTLYKLASLQDEDSVFMRGYRSAMRWHEREPRLNPRELRDRTLSAVKGQLTQLKTKGERDRYLAGVEQGLTDGAWTESSDNSGDAGA